MHITANVAMMSAGFMLTGYQLVGYFIYPELGPYHEHVNATVQPAPNCRARHGYCAPRSSLSASRPALLVTMVLPAEYGIDPTGVGRVLGLTEMGEIKQQLARKPLRQRRPSVSPKRQRPSRQLQVIRRRVRRPLSAAA